MRAIARARIVALTIATGVGVALTLTGVVNPAAADTAPPVAGTPVTASADALPAPQINGVVWAQAIAGNIAYAGGEFTTARPAGSAPGTNEVPRNNLLAYNLTTGELIASFNPGPNARVKSLAVTPDGTKLFVGGTFTTIGGATRYRLAAFDTATGALLPWAPSLNASVYAMAVTNSTVYIGGPFSSANQQTRNHLAAYSTTSATLLPWAPSTVDGSVAAMTVKPDGSQVVIGGSFTTLNGSSNPGMGLASVDGTTGALLPWAVNNVVRNAGEKGGIFALAQDGTSVYGTGWMYSQSAGTLEGTFKASWDGGALNWVEDCHGDTYGVAPTADVVYTAGHAHYCGNTPGGFPQTSPNWTFYRAIGFTQTVQGVAKRDPLGYHNWEGTPAPALLNWYPDINTGTYTGINQGAWNVITDGRYLLYGGEFTEVNGTPQQGLVRFALPGVGEKKSGPVYSGALSVPAVNVLASDAARITWTANYDYDNESLAYELLRDNVVVYSATQLSKPWLRPSMGYFDADVAPGTTYKYRLRATDPDGNVSLSDAVVVTTGTGPGLSAYQRAVVSDASNYWTLNEAAGTTVADSAGVEHAVATSTVQRGTEPAIFGDTTGFSARFTPSSYAATQVVEPTSNTFSAEGWFKTNTTRGGKLFGFGNKLTGNSSSYDRHVYMTNNGRLAFGVYNGATSTVLTSQQYNDNQWHHVVATLGPSGMALYVDGVLRASNTTTAGQAYNGVFRIGGDNLSGWPSRPSNDYFTGNIDDVALYGTVLSASQVQNHYLIGTTGVGINVAPTAAFTSTANGLNFDFDGTGSTDSDGTIVSYAWDFGDGASATGSTTTHTYAEAGTYTVSLTVTDNRGATHTTTQSVTAIRPPNAAPTAAFASSSVDLELSVDGSGSSDSDGSVTDYAWDFGDGSTGTGATASHAYAAAGTYTVTLTVTDNEGATGTLAKSVAVLAPNQAPTASFTVTGSNLAASVDGSASADTDGTISSYTWAWGDGATGVGATATHTYAAAGTYTITLTVTDNRGGTATTTRHVTLVQTVYAQDDFARTTTGNWGTATIGGTWTGSNIGLSTNGNTGNIALKIGQTLTTTLNTVSTTNLDLSVKFAVTQPITGSGVYVSAIGRQVGTDNYTVRTRIYPTGVVNLQLQRSGVTIAAADVPGMTYTTGQQLNLRVQVFGTSPTTLRAIVWAVGAAEPNTWLVSTTDSTAALQTAGFVGLAGYLGGSATSPVSLAFDDFVARPAN